MSPRESGRAAERRLFLARAPEHGRAELHADDVDHARRVLRLAAGDPVIGLDGQGHAWRLTVGVIEKRRVLLEGSEPEASEPPPGASGAPSVHVTLYVSLPRPGPTEEMLDRLTQLGAARIVPLVTERSGPHARELAPARRERLERIAREALKQSGRLWLPEIAAPVEIATLVERGWSGAAALLTPCATRALFEWTRDLRAAGTRAVSILVGPEGGLTDAEEDACVVRGATPCSLGHHVLRVETAAEAAVAVVAAGNHAC